MLKLFLFIQQLLKYYWQQLVLILIDILEALKSLRTLLAIFDLNWRHYVGARYNYNDESLYLSICKRVVDTKVKVILFLSLNYQKSCH